ncbi:ABC transporter A family member 2 [Rosa chinensis]|uniref:ABC transporter A family member 2 n=1 Tax=Rosa chinensis TaxID=74649 RepID=UPI001AD921A3|nr:ABC transporter A family member 2 [Rosa chinensis]
MMELVSGFPLLLQQFTAMFKKNLLLAWRHKVGTLIQLFSSFFFIFLIFCIQKALNANSASSTGFKTIKDPKPLASLPIPPCEKKDFIKKPCYDFVWSGDGSREIQTIVDGIMANNPGRQIPSSKVKGFKSRDEVDKWLADNQKICPGALHFAVRDDKVISYGVQTNSTHVAKRREFEDITMKFQIPLQIAAEREIARVLIGDPKFSWNVAFKEFPHPARKLYSAIESEGPTFFLATAMFGFVFQMTSLITEKELKLREAMTMMGLYDTAYWLSWLTWEGIMTVFSSLFIVLFGMMFQFDFFLKNNFVVLYLLFFLFQLNMIGFSFWLSAFISKASSSTTVGFVIFIIGFITQDVTKYFPYDIRTAKKYQIMWSFFPPNLLAKGLFILADATATSQDDGIRLSNIRKCGPNEPGCVMTISDIYKWLVSSFFLWFVLALYFDNILANASGVKKPLYYFLTPGYWLGTGGVKVKEGKNAIPNDHITPDDADVLEEEHLVKQQSMEGTLDPRIAVQIRGLVKTYPGKKRPFCCCCCCCCKETPPYNAVQGLWVNFAKDQLFCLLGPNGAGKSTTISCLVGITPFTGGDALVYDHSARSSGGMANIRKLIGVCPQFDVLWSALTGQEHLQLFATIKGLPPASIETIAEKSLAELKLTEAAKMRAGSYSGGMKRRLSVAIAFIGDPKLVILDEPTTGIDPITRRHVWDIIQEAKKGRSIVLTTHSMEEADILSDRIGIMAKGRLRCIGTSIRLKSRFGSGFIANVSLRGGADSQSHESVKQFFKYHLDVLHKEETDCYLTFVIPQEKEGRLTNFFAELQDRQHEFGIADIQLGLTTLEEVFLNISRQAELEAAMAEGRLVTLTLTSGKSVEIPVGAEHAWIPETESEEHPKGLMVEVYWDQDESGKLCIAGHSAETPVPLNVDPMSLH